MKLNVTRLLVLVCALTLPLGPARAEEPKEGDTVIRSSGFRITMPSGKKHDCRKAEFGTHKRVGDALVYHLGIVDFTCDAAQRTIQVICRVSWKPEESTPPADIRTADAIGVAQIITLDPDKPDSLRIGADTQDFPAVPVDRIGQVANEFLRDRCLSRMP